MSFQAFFRSSPDVLLLLFLKVLETAWRMPSPLEMEVEHKSYGFLNVRTSFFPLPSHFSSILLFLP